MSPTPRKPAPTGVSEDDLFTPRGCKAEYERLEECLGDNNRDWRKCQAEVKALRACHERVKGTEAGERR